MTNTGLSSSLRSLVNSLAVNQTSMGYLSDNISNANTVGYTRKSVTQETQVANGVVLGVGVAEIRRSVDEFLISANRAQLSDYGEASIKNEFHDRIQQFTFGDPNSAFTITNTLNEFYTRLDDFANDPSSPVKKALAITAAEDFANSVKSVSDGVYEERLNADIQIEESVNELNAIFSKLNDINKAIRQNAVVGSDIGSLLDARDMEIDKIKNIIDADISYNEFQQVSVSISSAELLGTNQQYEISYSRVGSVEDLINGASLNPITVTAIDDEGNKSNNVVTLLSASDATNKIDNVPSGKLRGLIDLRDSELKTITDQLDNFIYTFANEFNEVHNSGAGFPPASSLTGTEAFTLNDSFLFGGEFQIALVDENGAPLTNRYGDSLLPLTLNLDEFNGHGSGLGTASVQDLINEINNYYGTQSTTSVNVGAAHDIKAAAVSKSITSAKATGSINFAGQPANGETIEVNGVTFTYVNGTPANDFQIEIGASVNRTIINTAAVLNASTNSNVSQATYSTSSGSSVLNIEFDQGGSTGNGFTINSAGTVNATASGANLTGGANVSGSFEVDFEFTNMHTNNKDISFDISSYTISHGAYTSASISPAFSSPTVSGGERSRTNLSSISDGSLSIDLTDAGINGLEEGEEFTISAVVVVTDEDGSTSNETVTFTITVPDPDTDNVKNQRYSATAVSGSGDGELITIANNNSFMTASLVDADGNAITDPTQEGFLQLKSNGENVRIAINQLSSTHKGTDGTGDLAASATNKGFSHFFGLNNFFTFGGSKNNASYNLDIRDDIKKNPSLLSSAQAQQSTQTTDQAIYSFEIGASSNSSALELIKLQDKNLAFSESGGLPLITTTISDYITEVYASASLKANNAENNYDNQKLLTDSLKQKIDDVSGVNIDEEIALTIQLQNSYSASAKIISVVRELFKTLEDALL